MVAQRGSARTTAGTPYRRSRAVLYLSASIVVLALAAALVGLFWSGGQGPGTFVTLRGQAVQMFGHGISATTLCSGAPAIAGPTS